MCNSILVQQNLTVNIMKKFGKWAAFVVIALILLVIISIAYIVLALPDVGHPENITIAITPQRIARGQYLANNVALCMDCHSQRDWSKPIGEIAPDKLGAGGDDFDASAGIPGDIFVPNITPYRLKGWTDGEIFRAITTGERKDGSAIFPFMPWPNFAQMSREDLYSIIAYLRTLHPIKTADYPKRKLDFPTNILVHLMPQKADLGHVPALSDTVNYGHYLVTAASCGFCHSQSEKGNPIAGMELAGGVKFQMGDKTVTSANITPDKGTGIGNWTEETFLQRFKSFRDTSKGHKPSLAMSPMPWYDYSGMTETDIKAIYTYLRTVKPVRNKTAGL
jgi:mono/diheme cytochrome c family protein/cytochrome c2